DVCDFGERFALDVWDFGDWSVIHGLYACDLFVDHVGEREGVNLRRDVAGDGPRPPSRLGPVRRGLEGDLEVRITECPEVDGGAPVHQVPIVVGTRLSPDARATWLALDARQAAGVSELHHRLRGCEPPALGGRLRAAQVAVREPTR